MEEHNFIVIHILNSILILRVSFHDQFNKLGKNCKELNKIFGMTSEILFCVAPVYLKLA